MKETKDMKTPKVGDLIYVPTAGYVSHAKDDFQGGLCEVSAVKPGISGGETVPFISIKERPGTQYNWKFLEENQERMEVEFGTARGHPDPDYDPRFNNW